MGDNTNGLCSECLSTCSFKQKTSKNQSKCGQCNDGQPCVLVNEDGMMLAICSKCYLKNLKDQTALKKSQLKTNRDNLSSFISNQKNHYHQVVKDQLLNKSFFASQGKMVRKIQKYFAKFQGKNQQMITYLSKNALMKSPISWDKFVSTCNKTGSLLYLFFNKSHILGVYHYEAIKIGEKPIEDNESGFFMTERSKIDIKFYKATVQSFIGYSIASKTFLLGRPTCVSLIFQGKQIKVECDILNNLSDWIYQFIVKL